MDILDILLDILLKPPQPFIGLFLLKTQVLTPRSSPHPHPQTHIVHSADQIYWQR